jgi:hypothetical protein
LADIAARSRHHEDAQAELIGKMRKRLIKQPANSYESYLARQAEMPDQFTWDDTDGVRSISKEHSAKLSSLREPAVLS